MYSGEVEEGKSMILPGSSWLRAKISGMTRVYVTPGEKVEKGQLLFEIGDPFGDTSRLMRSPRAGIVVGINDRPVVNAGDALLHLGILPEGKEPKSEA